MQAKTTKIIISVVVAIILIVAGVFFFGPKKSVAPSSGASLETFAKCLGEKGAKFYGASWCSHCQNQKKLFGDAVKSLPYVECSTPDGNNQTQVCQDAKIEGYPTWIFADGSQQSGEMTLDELAKKTGCTLP